MRNILIIITAFSALFLLALYRSIQDSIESAKIDWGVFQ